MRFRVNGGEYFPRWTLSYRRLEPPGTWEDLANGTREVQPGDIGRDGLLSLSLTESGSYEVRLIAWDGFKGYQVSDQVQFTVNAGQGN